MSIGSVMIVKNYLYYKGKEKNIMFIDLVPYFNVMKTLGFSFSRIIYTIGMLYWYSKENVFYFEYYTIDQLCSSR